MANNFVREAISGGDLGVWAQYEQAQNRRTLGKNSCRLYNDSGALKISKGKIGIYDGSTYGTISIDTVTAISLVGLTVSRWAQIEVTFSGAAITLSITSIAAGSSYSTLPVAFTGAYNGDKHGYYINSTKRCIGLAWINAGGVLEGVLNCLDDEGYYGQSISDDANDYPAFFGYIKEDEVEFVRDLTGIRRSGSEIVINEDGLDLDFRIESDTLSDAFYIDGATGKVGIGTSSPGARLEVNGNVASGNSSLDAHGLSAVNNSLTHATIYAYNYNVGGYSIYSDSGINYFSGYVGIGTVNMHKLLTIDGDISMYASETGNVDRYIYFASDVYIAWAEASGELIFRTSGVNRMEITDAAELKIGGGASAVNVNSSFYFATDAYIFWDETNSVFVVSHKWDCGNGGIRVQYKSSASAISDAVLDSEFGTPAAVGSGFVGVFNVLAGAKYLVFSNSANWFYIEGTLAT